MWLECRAEILGVDFLMLKEDKISRDRMIWISDIGGKSQAILIAFFMLLLSTYRWGGCKGSSIGERASGESEAAYVGIVSD